jgi:hypothetical protein
VQQYFYIQVGVSLLLAGMSWQAFEVLPPPPLLFVGPGFEFVFFEELLGSVPCSYVPVFEF